MSPLLIALIVVAAIVLLAYVIYRIVMKVMDLKEDPRRWELEIRGMERRYKKGHPQGKIIFLGSSSFRLWETVAEDMLPLEVLNHGFGGSKAADSTYYLDRLVMPFNPRGIVLFAGTNDIHGDNERSKTGEALFPIVKELLETIHEKLPNVPLFYVSITPVPSRWHVWPEVKKANELIGAFCAEQDYVTFIDATDTMLGADGLPPKEIFIEDELHLNADGYAKWTSVIKPVLEAQLSE